MTVQMKQKSQHLHECFLVSCHKLIGVDKDSIDTTLFKFTGPVTAVPLPLLVGLAIRSTGISPKKERRCPSCMFTGVQVEVPVLLNARSGAVVCCSYYRLRSRFVLVALPVSLLQQPREGDDAATARVTFQPPLAAEKVKALTAVGMGMHDKVSVLLLLSSVALLHRQNAHRMCSGVY